MVEHRMVKPFEGLFVTLIFMFSTMWGLIYYWNLGTSQTVKVTGLEVSEKSPSDVSSAFFLVNWILDAVSWISPFFLVKGFLFYEIQPISANLYLFLDLFFIRPISWISSLFTLNYAISKIPTESEQ